MDQLKDILNQAIKYRFWIAVGISALLPIIAYAAGSGAIKQKAATETAAINQAAEEVKKYGSGRVPNAQYKPIVEAKKETLVQDVNASWRKLYARQAPLLTWPKSVEERFQKWGRKWPEDEDASRVQLAIIEYVTAYPAFVTEVYKSFQPFNMDPNSSEVGIVSAPTQEILLKPYPFTIENTPELGKIWAAQERLWTQRTLLEVINEVNKGAKDWNTAAIKQINLLEVGNVISQDQKSIAKGETLTEAPAITNPSAPPPPPATEGTPEAGGMGTAQNVDSVFYIKNDAGQFKVLPFELSLLIEQDQIPNLLVTLENSPMAVQVMEFEMSKPANRVAKPVKGQNMNYGEYSPSMMPTMMPGRPNMQIFGGGARMLGPSTTGGRTGVDVRSKDRKSQREQAELLAKSAQGQSIHDPYFNIIEVILYGQARFYNPPPPEPPAPGPSVAETAPTAETPPEGTAAAPVAEAPKPEGEAPTTETPMPAPAAAPAPAPAPAPGGEEPKAEPAATPPPAGVAPAPK